MLTRGEFLCGALSASFHNLSAAALAQPAAPGPQAELRSLDVPFDHRRPQEGRFALDYFVARPFDRGKPTILVVADGQQFYVRRDVWAAWQSRFGEGVNVVGVPGRGAAHGLQQRLGLPSGDGWVEAYRLLRYEQWVADIDLIRRALAGPRGRVGLYGASGGGRLVHEYLSRYGAGAERALTQAAVFTYLDAEFGLRSDRFWEEIAPADRTTLAGLLAQHPERREELAKLFQRQNFFVPPQEIAAARHRLIGDLAAGHDDVVARLRTEYQIDAIDRLEATPLGAAIRVRLYEFYAPVADRMPPPGEAFLPDLEVSAATARPLLELYRAGRIPAPAIDLAALHRVQAEVLMVAGRYDHTADYRSQIALASCYPNHRLLLLDDNHNFARLAASGLGPRINAAWRAGFASPAFTELTSDLRALLWQES